MHLMNFVKKAATATLSHRSRSPIITAELITFNRAVKPQSCFVASNIY